MSKELIIPDEVVLSKIYLIRKHKIMLDEDLAELYLVETKRLNEQVRRNKDRFPQDFMFQLSKKEWSNLKSQNATTRNWGGRRTPPYAFTEHGVLMLSSVLNSNRAIEINVHIMRVFVKMREMLMTNQEIFMKLEKLERKIAEHDEDIELIFNYLKELLNPKTGSVKKIGFEQKGKR